MKNLTFFICALDMFFQKRLPKLAIKGFTFPLQFCDIKKFLCSNRHLPISISVLYESEGHVSNLGFITNKNNDNERKYPPFVNDKT